MRRYSARTVKNGNPPNERSIAMSMMSLLIILAMLILIGVIPTWPYSRGWGYTPSGIVGVVLIALLAIFLYGPIA